MYQNLLFHVYMKLNMFRATHRPSSGAQNCTSSLWFCIRERLLDADSVQQPQRHRLLVQFELLMMGGVSPETCWASCKHGIINFDTPLHLVGYFCMNYNTMHGSTNIKFTNWTIVAEKTGHTHFNDDSFFFINLGVFKILITNVFWLLRSMTDSGHSYQCLMIE